MKDEMPLSADDFRAIRRSVMAAIEARRKRTVRAIQLAFAAIAIVIGVWIEWRKPLAPPRRVEVAHAIRPVPPVVAAAQSPKSAPPPARRHHRKYRKTVAPAASEAAPVRIELATADPDIRIIWISNPKESR